MDKTLAFQNIETLRAIDGAAAGATIADLARALERDPSNFRKTLALLADNGLIVREPEIAITDAGRAILAADDVAEGRAPAPGVDAPFLRHDEIAPDPDNARKDWDSEDAQADLQSLAESIRDKGLLQNLVVRPARAEDEVTAEWVLVGGERRWRAIGRLIESGEWAADHVLAVKFLTGDEIRLRQAALAENLDRRDLNPIEEATAYRELRRLGQSTEEIARTGRRTQRHVQGRLQLLEVLSEKDQHRMTLAEDDADYLSPTEARKLVQASEARRKAREKYTGELSPRQLLILAELRQGSKYLYERIQVDPEAMAADEDAVALDKAGLIRVPTTVDDEGRAYTFCQQPVWDIEQALFPEDADLFAAQMRAALDLPQPPEDGFSVPWLNSPFTLSPEMAARVEENRAERQRKEAEWAAHREQDEAARKEEREALERLKERVHTRIQASAEDPASAIAPEELTDIAQVFDHPLPWTPDDQGRLIDAKGETVMNLSLYYGQGGVSAQIKAGIVALAVNGAAGLATPAEPPLPEDERPLERQAFEAVMSARIATLPDEDAARLPGKLGDAAPVLDAYLAHIDAEFGAPDFDWSAAGARDAIDELLNAVDGEGDDDDDGEGA